MKDFLLKTMELFYGLDSLENTDYTNQPLLEFEHNPNILLLQGYLNKDNSPCFSLKIQAIKMKSIIFYKTLSNALTDDIARSVNIITLSNTPTETLYQILRQVYTPILTEDNKLINIKVQQNLAELETNLRVLAHGKDGGNVVHVILTIQDEIDYWQTISQRKNSNKKDVDAAMAFQELFEEVKEELRALQTCQLSEIREVSENISGLLDDIWRHNHSSYPQERMKHIFDIIGHIIQSKIQSIVNGLNIWNVHNDLRDNEVLGSLTESFRCMQTWTSSCHSLTDTYWPNHALHPWDGKPYAPFFCLQFQNQVKEVMDIKTTHHQLNKLLTKGEKIELQTDRLFDLFHDINIWNYGSRSNWENAISNFDSNLKPTESKIAEKLKPRLHNSSTKQMLYEFMRYKMLIQRPCVKQALYHELEIFLSSLASLLKNIESQINTDDASDVKMYRPPELSRIIHLVQWAKQMESKVKDIHDCAENYLREFEGCTEVTKLSDQVLKELKSMYKQLHEEWCRDLQAQVKDGSLRLARDKPVVEFSTSSKMMVVHFNPRLVSLEMEVRGMTSLGLPPPANVNDAIDNVARFLHLARALQQVASFHNTLGERMIPSTRPMMLQAALDLSSLVQEQKAVYWDNIEQVAHYSDMLKKAVLKLESQNSYLTNQHILLRSIVVTLMDTDLLAKQSEWKKKIKEMRDIIEKVEENGYKNTDLWRSHWDWQLYKALECQYVKTLLSLHKHFPHVKVDLVLRGREVRLQPPIEEVRVQHYLQLRRLISLPTQFVGVQNNIKTTESIFKAIVDKHSWLGNKSVGQLETTLARAEAACGVWSRRAALACVPDLHALCAEHLTLPLHWELNFKACKAYGQAVAKMTFDDEKIDWICIGTATLRREFEAQVRNLWGCLISTLQASCRADTVQLDAFIANAMLTLDNKLLPKNAKELSDISAKQQALKESMPEMEKVVEDLKKKGRMLHTWGGDQSIENTIKEWQNVHDIMLSQQQMFEQQAEIIKTSLNGDWDNLNSGLEAWFSRWMQNKGRLQEMHDVTYEEMCDRCRCVLDSQAQWEKYSLEKEDLLKECTKFGLQPEESDMWKQAETTMCNDIKLWTVFKEYDDGLQSLSNQEWIVFNKKLHLIEEFVTSWSSRLEPYTPVTLFMQQQLDKFSEITPLLKYLRGTDFTEMHWREVFSLLNMENKKSDALIVKDLLAVAEDIKKNVKTLQKICVSASNEAAVRGALSELELWFAGARLSITYYKDKAGNATPIVKEFKEIMNKIEEQQWVVSAVRGDSGGEACASWEMRLRHARALVRDTHHAQRRWLYLEPILCTDDGELGVKFRRVDQGFRQVARLLEVDSRLSALLQSTRLQPMLDAISDQLHACQSALNEYIDDKRKVFPRFYFLSDDDLLELLGQARSGAEGKELVMQNHLKKLFPGITGVKLGPQNMSITALCSHHGEIFTLEHAVDIDSPVEVWLKNVETEMRSSLKTVTLNCVTSNSGRGRDVFSLPAQIICLVENIRFTEQAEKAIVSKELHKLKSKIEKENQYYADVELEEENEKQKRQALILQCVHYVTIIQLLIDNNISTTNHWLWQKQLRFYLLNTKEVVAKMGVAQLTYSYEYLGINTGQFVRTELADECFLILTQAFHLGLVGNPFGPAGTGKTESVKALGGLVGRLVLVFNCDEVMDAQCMGRLLTGLAMCGAWGCFDEFNRLTVDTLSTVSHQFNSMLSALSDHSPAGNRTAILNGKEVQVSLWCGVAATMNPVGRGYGGRRALPAAVARVLRPAAMLRPRARPLADCLLRARALPYAGELADDLDQVFSMARELLSSQRHYDWGLRAMKAAVGSCAAALCRVGEGAGLAGQRAVLRRVLRHNNISKLTAADAHRFEAILSLVFNDVPEEELLSNAIVLALRDGTKSLNLIPNDLQIEKCVELYEQVQQRMGIVVVGPPGSGKSTIRRMLKTALTHQGKNIVEYVLSPKAMSRACLLGNIDHDTRQWTDGVISATALEISNQPPDVWSWVVCDGSIDPEWIEALNSVLDDNRLLTLPSGWRVQFPPLVNFLFETDSLEHASPATVSRMGIILLSEENSCVEEVLDTYLRKLETDNDIAMTAVPILQKAVKKCIQWSSARKSDFLTTVYSVSLVKQILTQFEYLIKNVGVSFTTTTAEELVYTALQRSVTCNLKQSAIEVFHNEMYELLGPPPSLPPAPPQWCEDAVLLSPRLARCEPAVRAAISAHAHVLLTGPPASAKNVLAEYVLKCTSNALVININCTPILQPSDIIAELKKNNVVRSSGHSVSRGEGAGVVLLVKSLHRTHCDVWGSSAFQEFLLQIIQHGGFWEESGGGEGGRGVQWCALTRACVVATADSTASSVLSCRLLAALCHLTLQEPEDDELLELATFYLKQTCDNKRISQLDIAEVAKKMLTTHKEILETFYSHNHYKWNASDLQKWCENIKWYSPNDLEGIISAVHNESNSIFRDRLLTDEEKTGLEMIISKNFNHSKSEGLCYSSRARSAGVYMEAVDYRDWYQCTQKIIKQCLSEHEYNIFGDGGAEVCVELATLCPALARATNGGVVVAVGSAGAGRRAAAHVVAAALPAALFFVNHPTEFNTQYKNALSAADEEGSRVLLMLCAGAAVASSLAVVEAAQAASTLRAQLTGSNHNLGIVIVLDKDQEDFSALFDSFPFLYKDCHLVWIDRWSNETLRQMPQLVIQRMIKDDLAEGSRDEHETIPVEAFLGIYNSLEQEWMRAPCRYVNFIKTYYYIVRRKKASLVQRRDMLSAGVEALRRARIEVSTLEQQARLQEAALGEKQAAAARALDQITATVRSAADAEEDMLALRNNIQKENEKLQIRKREIEEELASVEPVIQAARAAVGEIRPEALSEVRSLRAPPDVVRDVLEGVLRLMGIADTSWHSMKNFLSKRGVKEEIRCMDASQVTAEAVQSVQSLLARRGASFEERAARRASAACAPLAAWVRANLAHAAVLSRVQPLQAQQKLLHKNLKEAEDKLASLTSGLESVETRVSSLKEQLGQNTREAASLELKLTEVATTLGSARGLLGQLAHENDAWENDLKNISKEISQLSARSLLSAAYIVYLTDMSEPLARECVKTWSRIIEFEETEFSIVNFLSSTEKQLKWDADGLPLDKSAVKNAVIIDQVFESKKCGFTPFIVDPDGEAFVWLQNSLSNLAVDYISQHSDKLLTAVQHAMRFGRILVLTEVESIPPCCIPLLAGLPATTSAPHSMFRLVAYTRDVTAHARLPPHQRACLSVLHFTARVDGLTDQLVHFALQHQDPEVNEKARELKLKKATLQKQQYELQENLLKDLSSNADILHDANLLSSLNKTRSTSATISDALKSAQDLEDLARSACHAYEPSARRAAVLALAVRELTVQKPLVVLPVDAVLDLYVEALERGGKSKNFDSQEVIKYFTRRAIDRVLLSLRKNEKYVVMLHLLKQVFDDLIPNKLWKVFIESDDVSVIVDQEHISEIKKKYSWVPDNCVKKLAIIQATCSELLNKLKLHDNVMWNDFLSSQDITALDKLQLSPFEHVVSVATFRPECLYRAVIAFVDRVLGAGATPGGGAVERAARHAGARPVLLLSAHAADLLHAHAAQRARTLHQVWAGSDHVAWEEGLQSARAGGWLQLVVGAAPFSQPLQAFIATVRTRAIEEEFSPEFRMWITAEEREIPPLVSNACLNVAIEAPEGLKNNVMNTLSVWGSFENEDVKVVRTLACLALLHALVQERRGYIPEGWSRWYPFEWGDVSACRDAVCAGGGSIYGGAPGVCGALYGGRVRSAADVCVLEALVRRSLADHVHAPSWTPIGLAHPLPHATKLQAYATAFSALPSIDTAAMLGLPANCKVAWENKSAQNIIINLKELGTQVNLNKKSDNISLKPLLALWKKLMSTSPLLKGGQLYEKERGGWWWCVVAGEAHEAARAVTVVHATLAAARAQQHTISKVPEDWQLLWAGPDAPDRYLQELAHRAQQAVRSLQKHNEQKQDFPTEIDLRSLLRPARFLSALRAHEANRRGCQPRSLALNALWDTREGEGVVVVGLRLGGARWSGGALCPLDAHAPQHVPAPPVLLRYQPRHDELRVHDGYVEVPVYDNDSREEVVCRLRAPARADLDAGTATLHAVALYIAQL